MRLRAVAALAALAAATAPGAVADAATYVPRCHRLAVSPNFAKDGRAFCLTWVRDPATTPTPVPVLVEHSPNTKDVGLFRTDDRGRTWRRVESDLPWDRDSYPGGIAVSPLYAGDGIVAVHVSNYGVWTSTDGGETFLPADPSARTVAGRPPGPGLLTPFRTSTGPAEAAAFAFFDGSLALSETNPAQPKPVHTGWNGNSAIVPAGGGHVPVTGAPGLSSDGFHLSATFGTGGRGYILTTHVETFEGVARPVWRRALWSCDAALTCDDQMKVFPDDWGAGNVVLLDAAGRRLGVVVVEPRWQGDHYRPPLLHAWESRDGGATWRTWTAVERVLKPFNDAVLRDRYDATQPPFVELAAEQARHKRVVVRIFNGGIHDDGRPNGPYNQPNPGEQVWVSDDAGASFRRTAYGPSYRQRGKGTLPWHGADSTSAMALTVAPDGRIFAGGFTASGGRVGYAGLFCSVDGRRWGRNC